MLNRARANGMQRGSFLNGMPQWVQKGCLLLEKRNIFLEALHKALSSTRMNVSARACLPLFFHMHTLTCSHVSMYFSLEAELTKHWEDGARIMEKEFGLPSAWPLGPHLPFTSCFIGTGHCSNHKDKNNSNGMLFVTIPLFIGWGASALVFEGLALGFVMESGDVAFFKGDQAVHRSTPPNGGFRIVISLWIDRVVLEDKNKDGKCIPECYTSFYSRPDSAPEPCEKCAETCKQKRRKANPKPNQSK